MKGRGGRDDLTGNEILGNNGVGGSVYFSKAEGIG